MQDLAKMMFRPVTDGMHQAKWTDGTRTIDGWWEYVWQSDCFFIILEKTRGHAERRFKTYNDEPEWGSYKLIK
jgi:hypothetical protein